tara:strand:+ start:224 stop:481 length:258 start_codon:yes stop_codon:yes gene_type:complete
MSIEIKLVQDGNKSWEKMYRIVDYDEEKFAQQVIVLTREELGDLHHLIDVQFMAESDDHEKSMSKTQEEIDNEIVWEDHKNKWSE